MTTLLVRTHGRWDYLRRSLASIDYSFDRKILSCDGCYPDHEGYDVLGDWEIVTTGPVRKGLSANIAQAWSQLEHGEEVFDTEDDFVIHDMPLDEMRAVLEVTPRLAQMVLERQPVNRSEIANGGLLGGDNIPTYETQMCRFPSGFHCYWREQRHLFSFNPHLRFHDRSMVAGTEGEVTHRLLAEGRTFGFWGSPGTVCCEHIGVEGGMGSAGWAA